MSTAAVSNASSSNGRSTERLTLHRVAVENTVKTDAKWEIFFARTCARVCVCVRVCACVFSIQASMRFFDHLRLGKRLCSSLSSKKNGEMQGSPKDVEMDVSGLPSLTVLVVMRGE